MESLYWYEPRDSLNMIDINEAPNLSRLYHTLFGVDDVLHYCLTFLGRKDLASMMQTCRYVYNFINSAEMWVEIIKRDCIPEIIGKVYKCQSIAELKQWYRYNRRHLRQASTFTIEYHGKVLNLPDRYWCWRNPNGCIFDCSAYLVDAESLHVKVFTVLNRGKYRVQWRYMLDEGYWLEDLDCGVSFDSKADGNGCHHLWTDDERIRVPIYHWHFLFVGVIEVKKEHANVNAYIRKLSGHMKRGLMLDYIEFVKL